MRCGDLSVLAKYSVGLVAGSQLMYSIQPKVILFDFGDVYAG